MQQPPGPGYLIPQSALFEAYRKNSCNVKPLAAFSGGNSHFFLVDQTIPIGAIKQKQTNKTKGLQYSTEHQNLNQIKLKVYLWSIPFFPIANSTPVPSTFLLLSEYPKSPVRAMPLGLPYEAKSANPNKKYYSLSQQESSSINIIHNIVSI